MASELKVDTVSEKTTGSGVTIDSVLIKDGSVKGNGLGRKNLVMNGDFRIAQRGTSFSPLTTGSYPADRWNWQLSGFSGVVDSSISAGTPTGFGSSLKLDCTTADTSVAANNFVLLRTHWEGQDIQHLAYGTSAAKSVTISFWVFSTKTGTFNVSLYNADTSHSYIVDETVDAASTWEKKTITITGDTANGFDNDVNRSLSLYFTFSAGTDYQDTTGSWISGFKIASSSIDNFFDSTANEIYITGVQMEVGSVATDFEARPIAEELSLCRRYFHKFQASAGNYVTPQIGYCTGGGNGMGYADIFYSEEPIISLRATPTVTIEGTQASGNWRIFRLYDNSTNDSQTLQSASVGFTEMGSSSGARLRVTYRWGTSSSGGNFTNQAHYRINSISGSPQISISMDSEL